MRKSEKIILWFDEVSKRDIPLVGGKGANLGEMINIGIPVPPGFIVSANAYFDFIKKTSLRAKLKTELKGLDVHNPKKLKRASQRIQSAILAAKMPVETAEEIKESYQQLSGTHDELVAVRSSATAEDLPEASFAGQMTTFLNVQGTKELLKAVQGCWASLFTARAIFYRVEKGFDHFKIGIAVPVQKMVDAQVSGVVFTVDPLTSNPNRIAIEAAYGLGETVVAGKLTPDQYSVDKKSFEIVDKKIARQEFQLTREGEKKVSRRKGLKQKLPDRRIIELAKICKKIEKHYKFPQDIEWGFSQNKVWIVQTRPVTTIDVQEEKFEVREDVVDEKLLLTGTGASPGVAIGPVKIIPSAKQIAKVKKGDVLVTEMTNPDFVPAMKRAAAIVTDKGGRTSHAAIVSRELGIPCAIGACNATSMLKNGETVTVDGSSGKVYQGEVSFEELSQISNFKSQSHISNLKTATKLYVNLSEPEAAERIAAQNVDGVGLLRSEFVMAKIGVHPRKLIDEGKSKIFVDQLTEMVAEFCKNFSPRPVVYRANDFKTSEYRNLQGGKKYEQEEANPFMGFRGALRYIIDDDVFRLELKALKRVKNKMDFRNLVLMVPFVRTAEELEKVKDIIVAEDLRRSSRFKLWMMVEVPSNVVVLEEFAKVGIDGVSIGSNDLTMLTLGIDRDNEKIAKGFNEMNPAVLWMLEQTIKKCRKLKLTSSICGQAPSDYPELTRKLVKWGITSISVNPDVIPQTRQLIYEAEKNLVVKRE